MYGRNFQQGSYIIKQGEPGNHIFVLAGRCARFFPLSYNIFAHCLMIFLQAFIKMENLLFCVWKTKQFELIEKPRCCRHHGGNSSSLQDGFCMSSIL